MIQIFQINFNRSYRQESRISAYSFLFFFFEMTTCFLKQSTRFLGIFKFFFIPPQLMFQVKPPLVSYKGQSYIICFDIINFLTFFKILFKLKDQVENSKKNKLKKYSRPASTLVSSFQTKSSQMSKVIGHLFT